MSNALHTKDGAPIPKELRYSYPVDCIFLEYSHHWLLLQGENPLTHHHSWLCWDFLLLLDLPCKGIRQHLMALIRIPKFGKFLLVEWIPLTIGHGIQVPLKKNPESSKWNPQSKTALDSLCIENLRLLPSGKKSPKISGFSWGEEEEGGGAVHRLYLGLPYMWRNTDITTGWLGTSNSITGNWETTNGLFRKGSRHGILRNGLVQTEKPITI